MDITQLRTLIHVADSGSISKAAERLRIAQPALSRQIRLLEDELQAPLFVRHGRGMVLTDLGRRILEPASSVLDEIEHIRDLAGKSRESLFGRVRFGMTPTVAEVMIVPLAKAVRDLHPHLSLCFSSAFSGHLLDWVKRGELDSCVSYDTAHAGPVRSSPILLEKLVLVGPPERGLSAAREVRFSDLENEPLVLPSPLHGLRRIVDASAARTGITLTPAVEADAFGAMIDLVRSGFGCTILPLAPIFTRLARGELTAAPIVDPVPSRTVMITYPADRAISPATKFVGDLFTSIASGMVRDGIWAGEVGAG
ncbi:LysR family transcriptional regulator (plasmid) [Rhizorhabdus wittichii DC-6]|nr:LysR family transcriptional regulator [Rhizorhabdus wittichii DC-6]